MFIPKNNFKKECKIELPTMIHTFMLSPIFSAINISYRMTNMQCHEIFANFMYV